MPIPVIMPKLEMSQEHGTLIAWLKKEGETVRKGDPLMSVETDKLTLEVESPGDGVLAGIRAAEGERVAVTSVIAYLLQPGESAADLPSAPVQAETAPAPAAAPVQAGTAPAQAAVRVTPLAMRIAESEGVDLNAVRPALPGGKITRADVLAAAKTRAAPAARRLAKELDIPLSQVAGSGPQGRVQSQDVRQAAAARAPQSGDASTPLPAVAQIIPFKGMRRTIATRLQASYQTAPHITLTASVDMSELERTRALRNAQTATRISVTAFAVKALAWTLTRHPWLNSALLDDNIYHYADVNIGVAVALPDGLIVPVIHRAHAKPLERIAAEVNALSEKARQGKLTPDEVVGGTFTLTNLGPFGVEQFTAILNPPQTGILALGAAVEQPVARDGAVVIRPIARITLSADHRVVDGAVAAHFLADLKAALENPALML